MRRIACLFLLVIAPTTHAGDALEKQRNDIAIIAKQGFGSKEGRIAWDRLTQAGGEAVPLVLEAMDTADVAKANWFFTALDHLLGNDAKLKTTTLDLDRILTFAKNERRQGRARRVAIEIVEKHRPGTLAKLMPGWVDDPEFRADALALVMEEGRKFDKAGNKAEAIKRYRLAFENAREIEQANKAAAALLDHEIEVSVARHLGFLTDWQLIGPFDAKGAMGFKLSYPPEESVDLMATIVERGKKLAWKPYPVKEPSPRVNAKHVALVNLREARALGDADDAVAFAYTEFDLPRAVNAEFRGAADDNFTVWVNGKRVFGFKEYRNGIRFDRHRFGAELTKGRNTVLVKIVQSPAPNPEPNWEFILRVVDEHGRGLSFSSPK